MPCSGCGKNNQSVARAVNGGTRSLEDASRVGRTAFLPGKPLDTSDWVQIQYNGRVGAHYVPSPTRVVRHYGYYTNGQTFWVHPDDQDKDPETFALVEKEPEEVAVQADPVEEQQFDEVVDEAPSEPFDFTILHGIGPAKNRDLHAQGITSVDTFLATDSTILSHTLNTDVSAVDAYKRDLQSPE